MEARPRMPLHDLPLEQFLARPNIPSKTPRKHKRPLSPSQTTPLNPAKRRVLDAERISLSTNVATSSSSHLANMHTVTPTRPSRLGNGPARSHRSPQTTSSPLPSLWYSPSCELHLKSTIESSIDPQSRHYPGFDIFRGSPVARVVSPSDGDAQADRSDEDKENIPLRRKPKKLCPKKRFLTGLDGSDLSSLGTFAQMNKVVRPQRTPFSARQALR